MEQSPTKDRIIRTALRLFESCGYSRVSVDQIVKESGTSKGGFYHNFTSKDELLYMIHDFCVTHALEKAEEAIERHDNAKEQLRGIIRSFVLLFDTYQSHLAIFNEESLHLSREYLKKIEGKRDRYKRLLHQVIEEGVKNGEFRSNSNVTIVTMAVLGMINWIYKWYRPDGDFSLEEIADIYTDFVMNGLLPE
ncbi:TetR family transcriptional regulator [Melghirimyces profundicolus]|uniref:TetR family transcriptional regulator n=1 Tax=Melghirimyces profundicolus TaxID=1242148 RepID=A0A2T6C7U2_9BACL|nr:TetR/AcrR family transcriptional regulator [Melghirimyces profundicolus]PTX64362.1 TetR family transcriptional regulator [Melghirimyces profundicolus]